MKKVEKIISPRWGLERGQGKVLQKTSPCKPPYDYYNIHIYLYFWFQTTKYIYLDMLKVPGSIHSLVFYLKRSFFITFYDKKRLKWSFYQYNITYNFTI